MYRPTWAEVDLGAFRHNLTVLSKRLPRSVGLVAVLKADAYGHGAVPLARAANVLQSRLWGFGVSSVEEGLELRQAGVTNRVLILGSVYPFENFGPVLDAGLTPTVASQASALALARWAKKKGRPATCHVKIDTGMGRIGMSPATARETLPSLKNNPWLRVEGVYTHLACADRAGATARQLTLFDQATGTLPGILRHAANSGAALARPASRYDLVRPGLALYGEVPWAGVPGAAELRPVLSWKTRVVFLKKVQAGTPLSYGWTWRARRASRIATLPVGYGDGFRRELSNRGTVLVRGRTCPVVGRVTMDQVLVDVTGSPPVSVGDEVVLLGAQGRQRVTAGSMADAAGTIPYEILCGISKRVPRVTVRGGK